MALSTSSNFPKPDDAFRAIVEAHRGLSDEQSADFDAALVLILANHIGDLCVIEDHVWISSHAVLSGEVTVGAHSFLAVNATVSNLVRIGPRSYIGANTLITKDTPADSVYVTKGTSPLEHIDSLRFIHMIKA